MFLLWFIITVIFLMILFKFIYKIQTGKCRSNAKLDGKLAIITGASAGIGMETAKDLAGRGARIIMACRNREKAQKVADDIILSTGNPNVEVQLLDVCSLASVRTFAAHILDTEQHLHLLINNAGIAGPLERSLTSDGLELTLASNHYGHFLLTNLLAPLLKAAAPSRIVNVSSIAHLFVFSFNPDDMNFLHEPYTGARSYNYSKLCNILMVKELARRLEGTGVTAYSVHPGFVNTEIFFKCDIKFTQFSGLFASLIGKDSGAGAQTIIMCAVDEKVAHESGLYYVDCKATQPSSLALNSDLARKLWLASSIDVKIDDDEDNLSL